MSHLPISPPRVIKVSMAERQVRINPPPTPPPSQLPPSLPLYSSPPQDRRTLAQQEKDEYMVRSYYEQNQQQWSNSRPSYETRERSKPVPSPILLPPKAAFAHSESPLHSPASIKQAQAFGDAGSIRSGTGLIEGGRGAADVRKSGFDWSRFSVLVNASEKENRSEWLDRKQGTAKKWYVLGWIATILVVVGVIVGIVVGVQHKSSGDGTPQIPNLGVFNSKEVRSSSMSAIQSTIQVISSPSSALSFSQSATPSTSIAAVEVKAVEASTTQATSSVRTSAVAATSSVSVSSSRPRQISTSVAPTTTRSTIPATTSTTQSTTTTLSATTTSSRSSHDRRFLNHASFQALRLDFGFEQPIGKVKRDIKYSDGPRRTRKST